MVIKPLVLNYIIGNENVPTFVLIKIASTVFGVECIGRPASEDERSYWIFYDNIEQAVATFMDISRNKKLMHYESGSVVVGEYVFSSTFKSN